MTHLQASWTEQTRGAPGAFTLQMILDNGVDEYILRPTAEDTVALLTLWNQSRGAFFDQERKVLMFTTMSRE